VEARHELLVVGNSKQLLAAGVAPQTGMTFLMFAMFGLTAKRTAVESCAHFPAIERVLQKSFAPA
jgi:hypothetical protein